MLDQDYENYEIHVVVDNRVDTAWKVVHEIKEEFDLDHRLTIHEMREPLETCGLKCSALVQALDSISSHSEYLVLLDADVTPHRTWLSSCIRPLAADPGIGVVTGNQWFEPTGEKTGTLLRSLWNAGAIVPTAMYANPWAGTCAMRVSDVQRSGLDLLWRKSVVDDGPIRAAMTPLGLRVHFEPSLIMINREQCSTEYVGRYVSRMLTWSKLYEKTFVNTVVHACISNGVFAATWVCLLVLLVSQQWLMATLTFATLIASSLVSVLAYMVVRAGVRRGTAAKFDASRFGILKLLWMGLLVPYTQFVYGMSCLRAIRARQVKWREITYELRSNSRVRRLDYQPFVTEPGYAKSEMSI